MKSTVEAYKTWHARAGIKGTGKRSYWLEEGEAAGESRGKDHQQEETEGSYNFTRVLHDRTQKHTSAFLKVYNLNVGM